MSTNNNTPLWVIAALLAAILVTMLRQWATVLVVGGFVLALRLFFAVTHAFHRWMERSNTAALVTPALAGYVVFAAFVFAMAGR